MRIIKYLYSEIKKILTWHLYPKPDELVIKSFFEFLFYLIITSCFISIFYYWNKVPERNIVLDVEEHNPCSYIGTDSVSSVKARIDLVIPMTKKKYNDIKVFQAKINTSERYIRVDDKKSMYHYQLDTLSQDANSRLLYNKIRDLNTQELWKDFQERYSDLSNKKTLYFGIACNRGPNAINEEAKAIYSTDYYNNRKDTLHHLYYIEGPKDNAFIRNLYAINNLTFGRISEMSGEVLGVPSWYRFEDISQSYYNIILT